MKAESSLSRALIKDSSESIIGEAILEPSTEYGDYILRCTGPTSFKSILQRTGSNGFAEIRLTESKATPHSSPPATYDVNLNANLTDLLKKYYASTLILSLVWAILLYGLYVAGLASVSFVALLSLLHIASLAINSYLHTTQLRSFVNGRTDRQP